MVTPLLFVDEAVFLRLLSFDLFLVATLSTVLKPFFQLCVLDRFLYLYNHLTRQNVERLILL